MDDERFDVIETSVQDVHAAFEAGDLTATALVERYLRRIDAYDDQLNAILTVNPAASERAAELDDALEANGLVGPLHGIPVILKDNHATRDLPTTAGSQVLADSIPPRDAFVVERIREAGGIVLAKANLQELSFGIDTVSSLGGETRNAYALDRRPSGSSGGTAAAIAANLGLVGTGTDTCSSVRSPPAFNCLVGMRPTQGLVSRSGIVPLSGTQDTAGPIARTVEDAARLLEAMAGYDPDDPVTSLGVGKVPDDGYVSRLDEGGLSDARIGVVREYFGLQDETLDREAEAAAVTAVVDDAIDEMAAAGATIVDPVEVVDADTLEGARITSQELKRDMARYLEVYGGEGTPRTLAELVETGRLHRWIQERLENGDHLDVDVESLDENVAYLERLARRTELRIDTLARMADDDLDALLYPPSSVLPVTIPDRQPFSEMHCELASHTGLPAIVVPAGFTPDGLPVGVELLGREFDESKLFALAYAYEQASRHREPPAGFGPLA